MNSVCYFLSTTLIMQSDLGDEEGHKYLDGLLNMLSTQMRGTGWSMK